MWKSVMKCETTRPIFLRQKNSKKPFVPVSERISNMSFKQWIVSVLAVAACGLAPSFAAQPSIIIKFSHVVAADAPTGKAAEFFARRAAELTRGAVKADEGEIAHNPRSASVRLRGVELTRPIPQRWRRTFASAAEPRHYEGGR